MQPPYIRRLAMLGPERCKDVGPSFVDPYFLFGGVAVDGNIFPNLLSFPLTVKNHGYITLT